MCIITFSVVVDDFISAGAPRIDFFAGRLRDVKGRYAKVSRTITGRFRLVMLVRVVYV